MSLDSPFAHRIGTNYVPSPGEDAIIRRVIEQQCTTIRNLEYEAADIDEAIAQLEAEKREVMQRRETHQVFADDHRALLSSILRLSADILSDIFMTLVPTFGEWSIKSGSSPHPIVQISHVCRQLRAIALSTPMLWTTISVFELPLLQDASRRTLQATERRMGLVMDMLSTFIHRAEACPLVLYLRATDPTFPLDAPTYTRMVYPFASLLRHVQWKSVDILLQFHQAGSPLLQLLEVTRHSSDTLLNARLLLHATSPSIIQDIAKHLDLKHATHLTSLALGLPERALLDGRISWTTLTNLSLHGGLPPLQAFSVLAKCPNLIQCTMELSTRRLPLFTPPLDHLAPIILPHLLHLTISGFQPTVDFPQVLSLPSLQSLAFVDTMDMYTQHSGQPPGDIALPEWIRLHGVKLTHLTFSYGRITLPTLLSCLEGVPNLLSLEIRPALMAPLATIPGFPAPVSDSRLTTFPLPALVALTAWGERLNQSCSCPKLERLTIYGPQIETGAEYWVDLISSRRRQVSVGVSYLQTLDVCFQALDPATDFFVSAIREDLHVSLREREVSLDGIMFRTHRAYIKAA